MNRQDELFRALADPTRRAIFERLAEGEKAVKEVAAGMSVSQPAVSQHLAALRTAGLVSVRRDGRYVYYRVAPDALRPLVDWLERYQAFWLDRLSNLKALTEGMKE